MNLKGLAAVIVAALALPLLAASTAKADVTYTYTGNDFTLLSTPSPYTDSDSVTGTITFSSALPDNLSGSNDGLAGEAPVSFSFTDGVDTITNTSFSEFYTSFYFATDSSGDIIAWYVNIVSSNGLEDIYTADYTGNDQDSGSVPSGEYGGNKNDPGSWSEVSTVPEPASLSLFGAALFGLAALRRRRRG